MCATNVCFIKSTLHVLFSHYPGDAATTSRARARARGRETIKHTMLSMLNVRKLIAVSLPHAANACGDLMEILRYTIVCVRARAKSLGCLCRGVRQSAGQSFAAVSLCVRCALCMFYMSVTVTVTPTSTAAVALFAGGGQPTRCMLCGILSVLYCCV